MLKYISVIKSCTLNKMSQVKNKNVCVVVLGDIGRSPRMQYHGLSLVKEGYNVEFIGYSGSTPIEELKANSHVKFQYLYNCPEFKNYLPTILAYFFKVLWQVITLFIALLLASSPDYIIVQNPPAIPSLGVCYIYAKLFRSKLIIDWHNYAYSILSLSVGPNHTLVKLSRSIEFYFGRKSDGNICVTKAMKDDLKKSHDITAHTFYDRPPEFFKKATVKEKHNLFLALGIEYEVFLQGCSSGETVFTRVNENSEITLKEDRPALLISSTSWTEDEDFSILLSALEEYEKVKESSDDLPKLICAITGKGPLKEFYTNLIQRKKWKHVQIITPWLEAKDYPIFLGSADLGVCLHKSSSGLDLPMKVVDMFGCSVPVCAINFYCLPELVKHEENGFIFENDKELLMHIMKWFRGFPSSDSMLKHTFERNIQHFQSLRWHDNWKFNVQPYF